MADAIPFLSRTPVTAILPVLTLCAILGIGLLARFARSHRNLPPGPPGEFLIGNTRQIPPTYSWFSYTDLAKQYGDIIYLSVLGQPIIVLSSSQAIQDLLVKKSAIFSGRPYLAMLGDLMGWDQSVTLSMPTKRWQAQRKLLHQFLGAPSMPTYHHLVEWGARDFLHRVLPTTEGFMNEFLFTVAKLSLRMAYGIKVNSREEPMAAMAEEAALNFEDAIELGNFKVNLFPFLRHLPSWFPFAGFKRTAARWRERLVVAISAPFDRVKSDMASGQAELSFTARCLEHQLPGIEDEHIKWTSGSVYVAAARTTMATTGTFLLAMILHPDIQAKAQAELDRETGGERLPTLADRKNVPYIDQILKEVLRWHPATPYGVPHLATDECVYNGYYIPKGAIVYGNIWALSRNTEAYPSPEKFIPERFNDPNVPDPRDFAFGFGRRICAGQAFAEALVWITIATILATVDMRPALDENGNEIPPQEKYTGTMVADPLPFPYRLVPRSAHMKSLLEASIED